MGESRRSLEWLGISRATFGRRLDALVPGALTVAVRPIRMAAG